MTLRMTVSALALLGGCAFAANAFAQAAAPAAGATPAAPATPAPLDPKVKVFATLPTPDATENICQQADGSLYVSVIDQKKILKVTTDGKISEFASAPMMMHVL